jgi:Phytanoyl-CoA dioxygenase (PhyH)
MILERFLARGEPERIRSAVAALLRRPRDPSCTRPYNTLLPLRWCDPIVSSLLECARRVRAIRDAVGATDLRWISGYVSIKDQRSGPFSWHQDWWCWDHPVTFRRSAPQIAVLCYLDGTNRERGALRLLPGSHHRSVRRPSQQRPRVGWPADEGQPPSVNQHIGVGRIARLRVLLDQEAGGELAGPLLRRPRGAGEVLVGT